MTDPKQTPTTEAGICPAEFGGKREDCAAWPACACDKPQLTIGPMKCPSIGRNAEWPKSLLFYFDRVPTNDQMRFLHEVMQRAVACMPDDLS